MSTLKPDQARGGHLHQPCAFEGEFTDLNVAIYTHCYIGYRSSQAYYVFRLMGYTVAHYDGSWTDWAADPSAPRES